MLTYFDSLHTTIIPIKIKNGRFVLQNGKKLPKIAEDASAEIIIPTFYIEDEKIKKAYNREEVFTLFEKGTKLYIEMHIHSQNELSNEERDALTLFIKGSLVEVELQDDLKIKERGTKFPRLEFCSVKTTKLDIEAKSLNEMYSKLSLVYEKHRMSHTGNVFTKVYFKTNEEKFNQLIDKQYKKF